MTLATATVPTPPGPFTVVVDGDGAVVASGWAPDAERLLDAIGPDRLPRLAAALADGSLERRDELGAVTDAVAAYVGGDLAAIDAIPVAATGTPFLRLAWSELRAIPAGAPETYGQLAARCERPRAIRAAGSACARNPTALFVPCHRVTRTGGALGGFLYGLDVKRWLLAHEAAAAPALAAG
ncbi:methylated-DNA--[protein]-cysteine S-methyltransferase [Conexibacter arvalis]|uniref:Methylated-DNA-[protein]-cysteine S-methyltransferase n=1 Tax=Conexibacter arvalis TaxID=912552 RepID=A0A840IH03_9ACTN|nr:methylated-DNA--[protein]-cysteine S-methyltransferase [Conexibacter arvalis]MBB4663230.1 methylated-DNA-[protein]-cysteine S-methyltransferase [Conexibacter arvalis]